MRIKNNGFHEEISLLSNVDTKLLQESEHIFFANSGVTSLIKRLCKECKEKGIITLDKNSSTYEMLMDWAKDQSLLKILKQCLPIQEK
ncbi:MAG TPA: hypothetical protein VLB80_02605 [Candidatus Babeliales bacterium]|nr:hypothetical protein [Candidatus Babeliales bacterium]